MMKSFFFTVFLVLNACYTVILAQETKIDWNKNHRISETSSVTLSQEESFHLIAFRDSETSNYGILPIFSSADGVQTGEALLFNAEPSIVAFHKDNLHNSLVVLIEHPEENVRKLVKFVIDFATGKMKSNKEITNRRRRDTFISAKDKILRLHPGIDSLEVTVMVGEEPSNSSNIAIQAYEVFGQMVKTGIQWVNQNEFVKHGSTHPSKVYYSNGYLFFTLEGTNNDKVISVSLNNPETQYYQEFKLDNVQEWQDSSSYVYDEKLFLFFHNVNNVELEIFNPKTGNHLRSYTLLKDFKNQTDRKAYLPLMQELAELKFRLTGTVNKGLEKDQMVLVLDYVDNENYRYQKNKLLKDDHFFNNFHWNWMQQQQMWDMQRQQQQFLNSIPNLNRGGGPDPNSHGQLYIWESMKKRNPDLGIKLVLDNELNIPEEVSKKTKYIDFKVSEISEVLEKTRKAKHISLLGKLNFYEYLLYSKKDGAFYCGRSAY